MRAQFHIEVENLSVYAGYENIAFQKPATQSSTYSHSANPVANKAVDGNTNGIFNIASTTHTNDDKKAWWEVDLGHQSEISLVSLYNRIDCCKERLTNFQVQLFGNAHSISRKVSQGSTVQNRYDFKFPEKTIARYVRVQLLGKNYLSLAEVEVFGRVLGGKSYYYYVRVCVCARVYIYIYIHTHACARNSICRS